MNMLRTIFLLLTIGLTVPALAQKVPVRITAVYDSNAVAELYSTTPIGLVIRYNDSSERKTTGLLRGDLPWNQVKIETPNGEFRNGTLHYNRNSIRPDNYRIRLLVTLSSQPGKQHEVYLQLPFLTAIRFHHYADSLKRGIHFYLNVEGIFSSGRIYPLDTTRIRLFADEGQIIGQDLLIPQTDSITRRIAVKAVYRGNPDINAASVIPVKQLPDDPSLIIQDARDIMNPSRKKKKGS